MQMDKGIADPHITIFFNLKNKWHADTFYKLDESWISVRIEIVKRSKRFAKRSHIERLFLYETPKFIDTENRLVVARGWGKDI